MARKLSCSDLGFACKHTFEAENDQELLDAARQHAVLAHPEAELDDEHMRALIREET